MRVCVVGPGGREHALAWALDVAGHEVVVAPGNAGIPWSIADDPLQVEAELFVLGPDDVVVDGLGDRLRAEGRLVFGPGADGGRIEGSKAWMKALLVAAGVPTASYQSFTGDQASEALAFLDSLPGGYVVKTDGLAAGKGVVVTDDRDEAAADVIAKLKRGGVVIEEAMAGPELSLFAVCDGTRAVPLVACRDHKRVGDGDTGPNTGGMGAYAPVEGEGENVVEEAMARCVRPTLAAMVERGVDYRGVLYAGLMLTSDGPQVVEFNARFGDPEAQVLARLWRGDLGSVLAAAAAGELDGDPSFGTEACVSVAMCAPGYPGPTEAGDVIDGIEAAEAHDGVVVFCAGVAKDDDGRLVTAGGRVVHVTATGPDLDAARHRAYAAVKEISWPGSFYRSDIAHARLGP